MLIVGILIHRGVLIGCVTLCTASTALIKHASMLSAGSWETMLSMRPHPFSDHAARAPMTAALVWVAETPGPGPPSAYRGREW